MTHKKDSHIQDEELAAIADEIIAGNENPKLPEDKELASLVETIVQLESAFAEEESDVKERIRTTWQKEWKKAKAPKKSIKKWFSGFHWQNQRQARLVVAFAVLLLFVIAAPLLLSVSPEMAASAGAITSQKIAALFLGIFLVIVLVWGLRRK